VTEEQIALAKRAVACKTWRWMPGMAVTFPDGMANRVALVTVADYGYGAEATPTWMAERMIGSSSCIQWREHEMAPDLTDPATLGCLLALVREAWGDDEAYAIPWHDEDGGWTVCVREEDRSVNVSEGDTEAEALVAALEDAP
jgi:hypothetical protein